MFKVAWKSLMGRKLRLLLSTSAIVLGVSFVVGSLVFSDTLSRSFTGLFASSVGDVVVQPKGSATEDGGVSSQTLPASLVDRLAHLDGAARADGNITAFGVYVVGKNGKLLGGFGPPGIGVNYTDAPAGHGIEGLTVLTGHPPTGPDEVVLDQATAERGGYFLGEKVPIVTAGGKARVTPTLVGFAGYRDGGALNGASISVFDTATAQDLFLDGKDAFNSVWVTAADGVSQQQLRDRVATELPAEVEALTGDKLADDQASTLLEAIKFIRIFLLVFAGISLVVGAFLIVNTFSILVAQRSRELALLRALGASRRQVLGSVQAEALVLGFVGSTLGLGFGVLTAMGIRAIFGTFGLDLSGQPLVFAPKTILAAYGVGMIVTIVAAALPAFRSTRIAPVQALRDDVAMPTSSLRWRTLAGALLALGGAAGMALGLARNVDQPALFVGLGILGVLLGVAAMAPVITKPFLVIARGLYRLVFGSVGNLAGQNSLRNPRRTTATASALMISLALATTMAIFGDSAKASVDQTIADNFTGDYVVSSVVNSGFSTQVARRIERAPGVQEVVAQRWSLVTIKGEQSGISAADPATMNDVMHLEVTAGDLADVRLRTVAITDKYAEDQHLAVGDQVRVKTPEGTQSYPVVAVYTESPFVPFPLLTVPQTLIEAGFPDQDNFLIVNTATQDLATQRALEAEVKDLPVVTVKDEAGFAAEQRRPIDQLVLMIYAFLGLALLIGVLGIVNTLALSIIERTHEIGLLRAVGLVRGQLRRMITLESVLIAVLGAALGLVLGTGFGVALLHTLRDNGLTVISIPGGQLTLFMVAAVLIGLFAAIFPARRAGKLNVLAAIATE